MLMSELLFIVGSVVQDTDMCSRLGSVQLMSEKVSSVLQNLDMEPLLSQGRTHVSSTGGRMHHTIASHYLNSALFKTVPSSAFCAIDYWQYKLHMTCCFHLQFAKLCLKETPKASGSNMIMHDVKVNRASQHHGCVLRNFSRYSHSFFLIVINSCWQWAKSTIHAKKLHFNCCSVPLRL